MSENKFLDKIAKVENIFFEYEAIGIENLRGINSSDKIILSSTHITNSDVFLVLAALNEVAKELPRFALTKSVQEKTNFTRFPHIFFAHYFGIKNFIPLTTNEFRPREYRAIKRMLKKGFPILHAAYLDKTSNGYSLSDTAGIGTIYLASDDSENTLIVPISVSIDIAIPMKGPKIKEIFILSKTIFHPKAKVTFGKPYKIKKIKNTEIVERIYDLRMSRKELDFHESNEYKGVKREIVDYSNELMEKLAELLPEEKRGKWKVKEAIK